LSATIQKITSPFQFYLQTSAKSQLFMESARTTNKPATLRVSEIFFSLQGETTRMGLPTVFIRLTGCPLRCVWCDTEYAFSGGNIFSVDEILDVVTGYKTAYVCVTGGEPLAQKNCLILLNALCEAGYDVSLETSGALDISSVNLKVSRIVDLKAPGSGECEKNLWKNIECLMSHDELKFVLKNREDYQWASAILLERYPGLLKKNIPILFLPVQEMLDPTELAEWILEDSLPVRFQLQLHKQLWGNRRSK
jgi:7-carboxy-7-deazaguanine synthase